jgi:phage N-6-adenine-methyltransferase
MIRVEAHSEAESISQRALAAREGGGAMFRYDAACRAVAEAKSVDEVKDFRDKAEAMRAYAKQAKNKQLEIDASEIRFRAERRIGELMEAQKPFMNEGGRPSEKTGSKTDPVSKAPTLSEAGIDKHLADRARKYAAVPAQEFEEILADRRDRIETENKRVTVNLIEAGVRGALGTGENEWYTPDEHIALARAVMGSIDLDPASSHVANRIVQAETFYSAETNGLDKPWAGNVWLNPPYAQPAIAHFADKMVAEWKSGRVNAAIVLTHNYTDTAWFHALASCATAICFTRGRVRFVSPSGELAAPTQGQAFFYFGHDVETFASSFAGIGFVVEVRR